MAMTWSHVSSSNRLSQIIHMVVATGFLRAPNFQKPQCFNASQWPKSVMWPRSNSRKRKSLPLTEKNHNITLQGGMHSGVGKRSGHFCNSPQRGKPCYLSLQRKNSRFTGYRDPPSEDITEISIPKVVPLKGKKYLDSFKALVLHGSNCKNPLTYKDWLSMYYN